MQYFLVFGESGQICLIAGNEQAVQAMETQKQNISLILSRYLLIIYMQSRHSYVHAACPYLIFHKINSP